MSILNHVLVEKYETIKQLYVFLNLVWVLIYLVFTALRKV